MSTKAAETLGYDPASVAGKQPPIVDETDLLIVGAGPAGLAAALAAAGRGARVTLIDENPVPLRTMGEEVPLHFGGRMGATLANRNAALEVVLETNPNLSEAFDAGVDVRLGTVVWGLFLQRATAAWIDGRVAGLANAEGASLMRFKQAIVASGRRDMGLAFDGWQLPGVMGASAAHRLATTYRALDSRVAVLIGSGTEALHIGNALMDAGVHIEAVVEQAPAVRGDAQLAARLTERGVRMLTRHIVRHAAGDAHGVNAVTISPIDEGGRDAAGAVEHIECDTVLLGIATIPSIELLEAAGCATRFEPARGGHVAITDELQRTSLPFLFAVGDCAGTWPSKALSQEIACREARIAAVTALESLGLETDGLTRELAVRPDIPTTDLAADRLDWIRASVVHARGEPFVCQCEEVTAAEILNLDPPRYLNWRAPVQRDVERHIVSLACGASPNPDIVKRLTRAGMGPCQGRRCREQVSALLSVGSGTALAEIPLATFRPPVRPLQLRQLAVMEEASALQTTWDSWFGMASQWVPFWQARAFHTAAVRNDGGPVESE